MPETYEGVRLYTDVNKKDLKQSKKRLLKEMALSGTQGMRRLAREGERSNEGIAYNTYDVGIEGDGSTEGIRRALDAERQRLLGGYDVARKKQGRHHSEELDRIAAANAAYKQAMRHATDLSENALKERIEAMKLAAEARAGGGGGGGGGGGFTPLQMDVAPDMQQKFTSGMYRTLSDDLQAAGSYMGDIGKRIASEVAGTSTHDLYDQAMTYALSQGHDFDAAKALARDAVELAWSDPESGVQRPTLYDGWLGPGYDRILSEGMWNVLGNNWAAPAGEFGDVTRYDTGQSVPFQTDAFKDGYQYEAPVVPKTGTSWNAGGGIKGFAAAIEAAKKKAASDPGTASQGPGVPGVR